MGIDIGKSLKVAMIPIIILVGIGIFSAVIGAIPILNFLLCIIGIPLMIVQWVVLAWSGYKSVKEAQMDLVGAVVTGALAGTISGLVNGIIGFVLAILGVGVGVATGGSVGGAAFGIIGGLLGVVGGLIFGLIFGAVFGAIGGFVAGMKK